MSAKYKSKQPAKKAKTVAKKAAPGSKHRSTSARKAVKSGAVKSAPPLSTTNTASQPLGNVARQLRSWSDTALGLVGPMADMSLKFAAGKMKASASPATIRKAGAILKQAREATGLTVQEVAQAVNLRDAALLEQAEGGSVALPFEVILRLASIFGRHDPISFIMKITRSTNPEVWQAMEKLGVGKLAVHAGRERDFVNIYRASDEARELSEAEFVTVLGFVSAAFKMALAFRRQGKKKS